VTRVLVRFDNYRPFLGRVLGDPPPEQSVLDALYGTELVCCHGDNKTCTVAVLADGPFDIGLTLELVDDEGWVYANGMHFCPRHRDQALDA
jgi:hypothetical protein